MSGNAAQTPTRGVPVNFDGKERRLRYSFATRRKMMAEFGGEDQITEGLTGDKLVRVLWYGLVGNDPNLTIDYLEEQLDLENISELVDAMARAMGSKRARIEVDSVNPPAGASESATEATGPSA